MMARDRLAQARASVTARLTGQDEVQRNLDKWYTGELHKARVAMEEICVLLQGYAKTHHPWTPETGATDVSTIAFISEATPLVITAVLTAGMEYNVFLETARKGKWAWLWPAIEANEHEIKRILEERCHV
jgi:hypothetical protein